MKEFLETLALLGDHQHLRREKALKKLTDILETAQVGEREEHETVMVAFFKQMLHSQRWEDRFGAINGVLALIQMKQTAGTMASLESFLWEYILDESFPKLLVDSEFRVRNQSALLLKSIISSDRSNKGVAHFEKVKTMILTNILQTFERDTSGDASGNLSAVLSTGKVVNVRPLIGPDSQSGKTMHDSEGWKSLETSMRNLQNLIEAIGTHLYAFDLSVILQVIDRSIAHLNRFVREISYFVVNAIFETSLGIEHTEHLAQFNLFAEKLVPLVGRGLGDNWSQVRYASSLCARSFYQVIMNCPDQETYTPFNEILIPRMCLNRYYVAEGVRNYSIETWRMVFGDSGKQMVCKFADAVANYYISQSLADNHAVREAACHCISEICTKVATDDEKKEPFRKHITALLEALVDCFKD